MEYLILTPEQLNQLNSIASDNKLIPAKLKNGNFAISVDFLTDESFRDYREFLSTLDRAILTQPDFE